MHQCIMYNMCKYFCKIIKQVGGLESFQSCGDSMLEFVWGILSGSNCKSLPNIILLCAVCVDEYLCKFVYQVGGKDFVIAFFMYM